MTGTSETTQTIHWLHLVKVVDNTFGAVPGIGQLIQIFGGHYPSRLNMGPTTGR